MTYLGLVNNITLIIALSILYSFILRRWKSGSRINQVISGFLFGAVAVVGMMNPVVISPGLIFDGRSIIISIAGFMGGWVPALIAALMGIIYRSWLGGPGAIMGVSVIAASAAIGMTYHTLHRRRPHLITPLYLYGFGIIVHLSMLALTMTLPASIKYQVLSNIALPVILIYPLGTLLVGVMFLDLETRLRSEEALKESEERYRTAIEQSNDGICLVKGDRHIFVNQKMAEIFGYDEPEEIIGQPIDVIVHPDDHERVKDNNRRRQKGEAVPSRYEFKAQKKNGAPIHIEVSASRTTYQGEAVSLVYLRDITERKRAEETLRFNQVRFSLATCAANIGVWDWDIGKNELVWDESMYRLYDLNREEFAGAYQAWHYCVHPDDAKRVDEEIQAAIRGEKEYAPEFRIILRDGSVRYIQAASQTFRNKDGNALRMIGTNIDITERKRAEEALHQSKELYRSILQTTKDGFLMFDMTGQLLEVNEAYCQMSGYTEQELLSLRISDLEASMSSDEITEHIQLVISQERHRFETQHHRKDGSTYNIEVSAQYIPRDGGRIFVFIRDITERKRAEEALRESEEKYRNLFENTNEAIFVAQDGKIVFLNPRTTRMTGYSGEEILSRPFIEFIHPEDRELVIDRHMRRLKGEAIPPLYSFRIIHKGGNVRWVELSAVVINWKEQIATLNFLMDITESRQAEEEKRKLEERIQRAEKMEALGTLAGGVAHDLNNVLGVIVGYSELLLYDVEDSSSLRPGLMNILDGSQRAAVIVQDLLALARRGISVRQVLNLNKIIRDCWNMPEFENLFSYHSSLKIKTDLEPDLLNLSGSAVHLSKTLFNLVSNASEAMPNGGSLTITTSNQYLDRPIQGYDEVREGDYVVLSVSDTGEGIPPADLKRIFEPFYTKKVMGRSGTGLGLAVVWGTVKDHQGYINAQSEEGKGSTFTLYFPVIRDGITAEDVSVPLSEYMGKGETILIVDDVKGQRDLADMMLSKLNYNITSVESGEEAAAYLKEHTVDLLVLDMIMDPGMDGLDTYKNILKIHPQQKAIIVSGFSETERVNAAQALGAGAYVRKPYVMEKLGLAVRKELDRNP